MDPLSSFPATNPFATFYPPQTNEYDPYAAISPQEYTDLDMSLRLYSPSEENNQANVVANTLYGPEPNFCSALPLLHSIWNPQAATDHVSTPPMNDAVLPQPSQLQYVQAPGVLLHSPVPVSGASWPIISPELSALRVNSYNQGTAPGAKHPALKEEPDLLQVYANVPRETFPTPSELLNKAANKQKSTDPDTISSHDKKRYYLECLEQYITFLHEQLRLVGHEPVALERVSTYRGLTSRSIRVFSVSLKVVVTHEETIAEEKNFLNYRDEVLSLDFPGQDSTGFHELSEEMKQM